MKKYLKLLYYKYIKGYNKLDNSSQRHGMWITFHDNGNLNTLGSYSYGLKDGYWFFYYENGNIKERGHYVNNLKEYDWFISSDWINNMVYDYTHAYIDYLNGEIHGYIYFFFGKDLVKSCKYKQGEVIKD